MAAEPTAEEREEERARIANLLEAHAPADWETTFAKEDLLNAIVDGRTRADVRDGRRHPKLDHV